MRLVLPAFSLVLVLRLGLAAGSAAASGANTVSIFGHSSDESAASKFAESVDLKSISSADITFLIKERRWITAAQIVLKRAQESIFDFSAPTRSAVTAVRKELDDLIRSLDKKYDQASQVSPAFQWAQNSSHIFIQIKFAQRWNAPGALEVHNTSIVVSDCCFSFKGHGEHSMIKKEYKLFLQFLEKVDEARSSWHFAAAGRLTVTVAKARARKWERLLRSENIAPENMGVWQDMQAKWKTELAAAEERKGAQKLKKTESDDDDDEDVEEDVKCEEGIFKDSKVAEFCPDKFLPKGFDWSVLFYGAGSAAQKSPYSALWRVMADAVPNHNKRAKVAAIDCSRHRVFCEKKGLQPKELPKALRYKEGSEKGIVYAKNEIVLEDLIAWAAGVGVSSEL